MRNKLIPKMQVGGALTSPGLGSYMLGTSLDTLNSVAKGIADKWTAANPITGKAASFMSKAKGLSGALDSFAGSAKGSLVASGLDMVGGALGIKPKYNLNSNLDKGLGMAESISKNFGNPVFNAATDFAAGGIGKLMGLNTGKVVGGGMAGVNAVSNVLSSFGPIGMAAGAVLKIGNMMGGKNLSTLDLNSRVQRSSGYAGSAAKIKDTSDKYSGGMVSGIDNLFGQDEKYEKRLAEARETQNRVKGILNTADNDLAAQAGSADMFRIKNTNKMGDNSYMYNGTLSVKQGGRIQKIIKAQLGVKAPTTREDHIISNMNKKYKDVNFLKRLNTSDFVTIPDWEDSLSEASHKLSYTEADGKFYAYPNVQEIDGKLHDFTDPKNKHYTGENYNYKDAIESAFRNNDVIPFDTEEEAAWFTSNQYKRYFPATKGLKIEAKNITDFINKHQEGGVIEDGFEAFRKTLPAPLQDTNGYRLKRFWELNGKMKNFDELKANKIGESAEDGYHLPSVGYNKEVDEYEFLKYPNHPTIDKELDWYNSKDGSIFKNRYDLDKSGEFYKYTRRKLAEGGVIEEFGDGGKMNLIPEGALHARKHSLDIEDITHKGIPVISHEEGGEVVQHAEIERNEIVFTKEVSDKLEDLWKEYQKEGLSLKKKDLLAIQAGALLTFEIIENTDDRTGLMTKVD